MAEQQCKVVAERTGGRTPPGWVGFLSLLPGFFKFCILTWTQFQIRLAIELTYSHIRCWLMPCCFKIYEKKKHFLTGGVREICFPLACPLSLLGSLHLFWRWIELKWTFPLLTELSSCLPCLSENFSVTRDMSQELSRRIPLHHIRLPADVSPALCVYSWCCRIDLLFVNFHLVFF